MWRTLITPGTLHVLAPRCCCGFSLAPVRAVIMAIIPKSIRMIKGVFFDSSSTNSRRSVAVTRKGRLFLVDQHDGMQPDCASQTRDSPNALTFLLSLVLVVALPAPLDLSPAGGAFSAASALRASSSESDSAPYQAPTSTWLQMSMFHLQRQPHLSPDGGRLYFDVDNEKFLYSLSADSSPNPNAPLPTPSIC